MLAGERAENLDLGVEAVERRLHGDQEDGEGCGGEAAQASSGEDFVGQMRLKSD